MRDMKLCVSISSGWGQQLVCISIVRYQTSQLHCSYPCISGVVACHVDKYGRYVQSFRRRPHGPSEINSLNFPRTGEPGTERVHFESSTPIVVHVITMA